MPDKKKTTTRRSKEGAGRINALLADIRGLILAARRAVVRSVDTLQVLTSFEIGRRIVEQEQHGTNRAAYGKVVVEELAKRLTTEFGKGFSKSNLEYMRRFYTMYRGRYPSIAQTVSGQLTSRGKSQTASGISSAVPPLARRATSPKPPFALGWSHYVLLMGIGDPDERAFYEIEAVGNGWSSWRSPCPRVPTSMPGSTGCTCRRRKNCGASSLSGPRNRRGSREVGCGRCEGHSGPVQSSEQVQSRRAVCAAGWGKWPAEELILMRGSKRIASE